MLILKDTELHALIKLLNDYFLCIQEPPITEPMRLLIYCTGIETAAKLEKKYYQAITNKNRSTNYKIKDTQKAFIVLFLEHLNIRHLQPWELASRESILYKIRKL